VKRTLALGGAVVGMLAYAAVAAPAATAKSAPAPKTLAQTNFAAQQVAAFWLAEKAANLEKATPYGVETILKPTKHKSTVPSGAATTKPGLVGSSGDKKSTATAKNVNLPRTVGKVFFIGADGKPHWCTGTALQGRYKNLVATAGHCVFDIKRNKATLDKWVFVPGYYKGKTPWGIYVGKTAYTHYDFSVYEDYDRNYAFVTVYNGVQVDVTKEKGGRKLVTKEKVFETYSQARRAAKRGAKIEKVIDYTTKVRRGTPGSTKVENASVAQIAVDPATINTARKTLEDFAKGAGVGSKLYDGDSTWGVKVEEVSKREFGWTHRDHWNHPSDATKQTAFYFKKDQKGPDKYYKATFWAYFDVDYKVTVKEWEYQKGKVSVALKDVGRLGDNVGGQGLAYNQKLGAQPVFVFGYPSGSHPDGNAHFTGQTLKWSYGKPFAAQATAQKAENLQGIKSAFTGEGALGSAWLLKYSNATRLGYLNGVTIGVADTDGNGRYDTSLSPYFDGETLQVYQAAEKNWSGKIV